MTAHTHNPSAGLRLLVIRDLYMCHGVCASIQVSSACVGVGWLVDSPPWHRAATGPCAHACIGAKIGRAYTHACMHWSKNLGHMLDESVQSGFDTRDIYTQNTHKEMTMTTHAREDAC